VWAKCGITGIGRCPWASQAKNILVGGRILAMPSLSFPETRAPWSPRNFFEKGYFMNVRSLLVAAASIAILTSSVFAEEKVKLEGVKCVLNPKAGAKAATAVDYKGGKVYFCCGGCAGRFAKDPAKHAVRANHQLVATKQAKQVKCPLSGGPCKPDHKTKVGGVNVCFCCPKCKGRVEKAEGDEQLALLFTDKAFANAFKVAKKKDKK